MLSLCKYISKEKTNYKEKGSTGRYSVSALIDSGLNDSLLKELKEREVDRERDNHYRGPSTVFCIEYSY